MNVLDAAYRVLSKAMDIFQTGLIGCILSFDPGYPVILPRIKEPQINADERGFIRQVSSFIYFHPQLIDLKQTIKKNIGGWLFDE